jgi:MFS family permease
MVLIATNGFLLLVALIPALIPLAVGSLAARAPADRQRVNQENAAGTVALLSLLALPTALIVLRAFTITAFQSYLPLIIAQRDAEPASVGLTLATLQIAGAAGGLVGGVMGRRTGHRAVLMVGFIGPIVPLLLAISAPRELLYLSMAAAGTMLMLPLAANLSLALDRVPARPALASAVVIGIGWGIGSAAAGSLGVLADLAGVDRTLQIAALALLPGIPLVLAVRSDRR